MGKREKVIVECKTCRHAGSGGSLGGEEGGPAWITGGPERFPINRPKGRTGNRHKKKSKSDQVSKRGQGGDVETHGNKTQDV